MKTGEEIYTKLHERYRREKPEKSSGKRLKLYIIKKDETTAQMIIHDAQVMIYQSNDIQSTA